MPSLVLPCTPLYTENGSSLYQPFEHVVIILFIFFPKLDSQSAVAPLRNSNLKCIVSSTSLYISGLVVDCFAVTATGSSPVIYRAAFKGYTPISYIEPPPIFLICFQ